MNQETIKTIIRNTLERASNELAGVRIQNLQPEQNFFGGKDSAIDSLNLVAFIFILEDEFKKATGKPVKVSTQDILSKEEAPFKSLNALEAWLTKKAGA